MLVLLFLVEFHIYKLATHESLGKGYHLLWISILCYALAVVLIIISLLGIIQVEVDEISGTILFKSLVTKNIIYKNEITSYYSTRYLGRGIKYYGLQLNLENNKTLRLAEQNLKNLSDFKEYLTSNNIDCLGEKLLRFLT